MQRKHTSYIFLAIATLALCLTLWFHGRTPHVPLKTKFKQTESIQKRGDTLKALIFYHAADYFVYHGSVIGFQYDLLKQMGKDLNKPISITIEADPDKAFLECFTNHYDIISFDFNKQLFVPDFLSESEPHSYTYPVLIMRKGMKYDSTKTHIIHASARYSSPIDLGILGPSGQWRIEHHPDVTVEDLFDMLGDTAVDYVVCNYNVAITMLPFYSNLSLGPRIGENFPRTWALNKHNAEFNDTLNMWLRDFKETNKYQNLCKRYLSRHSAVIQNSFGTRKNKISSYDNILKTACKRYNLDWRFMSSIIFQESHFSSDVLGMGGSFGIMQMMPATCARYGITDSSTVEEQIWAGAKYISFLHRIFVSKVDSSEIYSFVAASYNSGPGHILDAIALCNKYGEDASRWDNTAKYLALKSHKEYYNDPVVKCGYYPGKHTIHYVQEVMNRYNGYLITKQEE